MGQLQLCLFAGLAVGYLHHFGFLRCIEVSSEKAADWETKVFFKGNQSFIKGPVAPVLPISAQDTEQTGIV